MTSDTHPPGRPALTAVVALAALSAALAWSSQRTKSLTFDEVVYIPAGHAYLTTGDYRLNPEHPPLAKILGGAALVGRAPPADTSSQAWRSADQWAYGRAFFDRAGPATPALVSRARTSVILLTAVLVGLAFATATTLFGARAGLLAAWLCAFSPNLLAHGRLVTTDLPLTCFFLATLLASIRLADRPAAGTLAGAGATLALALASKYSALLLVGLVPVWVVTWRALRGGTPLPGWLLPGGASAAPARRALAWAGAAATVALVAALIVSATYGAPGRFDIYVRNLGVLYSNVHLGLPPYFAGRFHPDGLPYYFAAVFLLKAPLALLLLLVLRLGDQVVRRDAEPHSLLFLLGPALGWIVAMQLTALPLGVRYILPAFPLLFVYAAGIAEAPRFRGGAGRWVVVGLATLFAAASLRAYPHYLPFFNALAGGPEHRIEWLDDSNVDWGQDLPLLASYLEERGASDAVVVPMGWYDPTLYGVRGRVAGPAEVLPLLTSPDPPPGVYAVSAHLLTRARWGGTPAVDPLRDLEPSAVLGHSIFVFEVPGR